MKKKVITATAMMALAAMAMSGCGQSSAPAETTAAATDAPAEDTTASSDETKEIGSKRTNFRLLPMLLRLFRPFILSIQNNQNHNQRYESHAGSHPAIGGNSGCQITEETARRYAQHIRDLGRYVVDVVALGASRRKDGRIRDRGNMVAADRTCQNRSRHDRKAVHIFSANHRKCNRKQNTEGTPGRTGRERQPRRDDEHQGRHQGADQRIAAHYLFDIAADV